MRLNGIVQRLLDVEQEKGLAAFLEACRSELELARRKADPEEWQSFLNSPECTRLQQAFLEDPYTRRGFERPRGYAGDAVLLDYIYGTIPIPESTTRRGNAIHAWMYSESHAFHAVRHRRWLIAAKINDVIAANPSARILSIGCGHLRELALCVFGGRKWDGELVAVDQDVSSLAVAGRTYCDDRIKPTRQPISKLVGGQSEYGSFDFIYAAGLLDYLDDPAVVRLVDWCCQSLSNKGTLLLANFSQCQERGFMESVMRWILVYRTGRELCDTIRPVVGVIQ